MRLCHLLRPLEQEDEAVNGREVGELGVVHRDDLFDLCAPDPKVVGERLPRDRKQQRKEVGA